MVRPSLAEPPSSADTDADADSSFVHYFLSIFKNPNIIIFYRLGGWVQSTVQDDFIFEHGPRTIRPAGPQGANTLELIEELGLESKLKPIKYGHPATVNR